MITKTQNYLSFVGGFTDEIALCNLSQKLPSKTGKGSLYFKDDFGIIFFDSDNPLYSRYIMERGDETVFVSGFFYNENKSVQALCKNDSEFIDIKLLARTLNGSFVIIVANRATKSIWISSDYFGFEKVYFSLIGNNFLFSSHIWPLTIDKNLNRDVIGQHLSIGYPIGDATIFEQVFVHKPSNLTTLSPKGKIYEFMDSIFADNSGKNDVRDLLELFREEASSFFNFLASKFKTDNFATTLTGGGETRVILNSLLLNSIKPVTITGDYPPNDILRAEQICKLLSLANHKVVYDDYLDDYWSDIEEVVYLSNGYTNGWWMSLISKKASEFSDFLLYGFSGDLLAGSSLFNITAKSRRKLVIDCFHQKSLFKDFDYDMIAPFTEYSYERMLDKYLETFWKLPESSDWSFTQERNEFNFKRVSSFADGSRTGNVPIFFFHNSKIIQFYRSLDSSFLKNEKFHRLVAEYKNELIIHISSAAKSDINPKLLTLVENFFGKQNLYKISSHFKKILGRRELTKNENFYEFVKTDFKYEFILKDLFDWEMINSAFSRRYYEKKDLDTLKMRLWDLAFSFNIAKNISQYSNSSNLIRKWDPNENTH